MHPYHKEILGVIEQYIEENNVPLEKDGYRYLGTTKPFYYLRAAQFRGIVRNFADKYPHLRASELADLAESLSTGETYNEYASIGLLLEAYPLLRAELNPHYLDKWLEHAEGWAEVDVICQFIYTAEELLADWESWNAFLDELTLSKNIHKQRASLVLLTKPLRQSADARISAKAVENVERLKSERAVLITKAVSWVLRAMIKYHREEVKRYLEENSGTLPRIAIRETRNKLMGGTKEKRSIV